MNDSQPAPSTALALDSTDVTMDGGRDWGRAIRGIGNLARKTDDTNHVFEIIHALEGNTLQKSMARMLKRPEGRKLMETRSLLNPLLMDRELLGSMPEGSLGRAYLAFMIASEITADGLDSAQDEARENDDERKLPEDYEYLAHRFVEQHDLWHVLSGYGSDDTGELANLWFSYGQFGQLGMGFIALLGTFDGPPRFAWWRYMYRALRRGRRARFLVAQPIEQMLELPLSEVRTMLNIVDPAIAHPGGMFAGNRSHTGIGRIVQPAVA